MCPECGSKNVVDLNKTGQDRFVIVFGGSSNKVCQDCNCQFLFCHATGRTVTRHGRFFNNKKADKKKNKKFEPFFGQRTV
mgnify:CR=1 FL=1